MRRAVRAVQRRLGEYWTVQFSGWTAFALVSVLTLLPVMPTAVVPRLILTKVTRATFGLAASDLLRRLYSSRAMSRLPAAAAVTAQSIAVITLGVAWYALFLVTAALWSPRGSPPIAWAGIPHGAMDSVVVLAAWTAAYFGVRAWRRSEVSAREAEAARARADRAQLDALRYQLNPHFLFNALSSIRALIAHDPAGARAMITRFADMLRGSLDASAGSQTTVRDEIAGARNYLEIERVRFEDSLEVTIDVAERAAACLLPTFILHPLVENAIVHGRRGAEPLCIALRADAMGPSLRIEVANTGTLNGAAGARPANGVTPSSHGQRKAVGVASVRDRLALLYPGHHRFALAQDGPWVRATIEIDIAESDHVEIDAVAPAVAAT